jgi:hypothetical protein
MNDNFRYPGNLKFNSRTPGIFSHADLRWDERPKEYNTPMDAIQFAQEVAAEYGVSVNISNGKTLLATVSRRGDVEFKKIGGTFEQYYQKQKKIQDDNSEE